MSSAKPGRGSHRATRLPSSDREQMVPKSLRCSPPAPYAFRFGQGMGSCFHLCEPARVGRHTACGSADEAAPTGQLSRQVPLPWTKGSWNTPPHPTVSAEPAGAEGVACMILGVS